MGERVDALEAEMGEMKSALLVLSQQMQQQSAVLSELSKQLEKRPSPEFTQTSESSANQFQESQLSGKKVKLPVFEGDDPVGWITRAEIYFDVQKTSEEMRVKLARLSMEGTTIHWFNLLMETEDELSWEKLKKALIARYGGRRLENPFEELSTLRQKRGVEEYVEAFELLSSQVGKLPEEQYLGYFMSGLQPQIRRRVRTLNPQSRMQMMRMVKDVEDELKEEDDDDKSYGRKGANERVGRNDWAGSQMRDRSGSIYQNTTRSGNGSRANPVQKTGLTGSNSNSTASVFSTAKKGENSGSTEKWKGI